jgi:PAS domain S-box-containing protein
MALLRMALLRMALLNMADSTSTEGPWPPQNAAAPPDCAWDLIDAAADGIAVTRPDGVLVHASAALAQLTGRPAAQLTGTSVFDLFAPEARGALRELQRQALSGGVAPHRCVRGAEAPFAVQAVLRRVERPAGCLVVWALTRIAGAAPAPEPALWGSEIGIWELDVPAKAGRWWNKWCDSVDIDPCDGADEWDKWRASVHPDDQAAVSPSFSALREGRSDLYEAEYRMRTRAGGWRWILTRARATARDEAGRALRIAGVAVDIDARKRAELALRESESRLEAAVWGTDIGLWERQVGGSFRWFDDWCARHDIDPCEGPNSLSRWHQHVHPQDVEQYARTKDDTCRGLTGHYVYEYRVRTRDGQWRWLHERGKVTARAADGRALHFVGVCFDVDARKQMEWALRDSEARLETAIWGSDLGLWDCDWDSGRLAWLTNWSKRFGIDAAAPPNQRHEWLARISPLDRRRYEADDQALIDGVRNACESDYRILSSQLDWRWVNVRKRVIARDAGGRGLRMVGACIEVDSRRRAEQLLRTQALILDTMREGVVLSDLDGQIEFTNPAFDRMFGRDAGDFVGTSLIDLFMPQRRGRGRAPSVERLLKRFSAPTGKRDVVFRRRDGGQFAGEVLAGKIELSGETKSLVVIQDVSERKHLERGIIEIANRERRRQGSDLHDGIGQELTGISLMLRSLSTRLGTAATQVAPELDEVIGLVNHAIQSARTMALGLSPVNRQHGGLQSALTTLTGWSRENYHIDVRLRLVNSAALTMDEAAATHLYLIAQEAINNAVKHGRARIVTVTLRVNRSVVTLAVADDGIGIAANPARTPGMGLKIMEYRAGMIGGALQIKQLQRGGTRVRCVCPQQAAPIQAPTDSQAPGQTARRGRAR